MLQQSDKCSDPSAACEHGGGESGRRRQAVRLLLLLLTFFTAAVTLSVWTHTNSSRLPPSCPSSHTLTRVSVVIGPSRSCTADHHNLPNVTLPETEPNTWTVWCGHCSVLLTVCVHVCIWDIRPYDIHIYIYTVGLSDDYILIAINCRILIVNCSTNV